MTEYRIPYKYWLFFYTLIYLLLANFGLNNILEFSLPVLTVIYPPAILLIIMALLQDFCQFNRLTYRLSIYLTFSISTLSGLSAFGIEVPYLSELISKLPFHNEGLEWILPVAFVLFILTIYSKFFTKETLE